MLTNTNIDIGGGIFLFNPVDDPYHMERIERNITSIAEAATDSNINVNLILMLNRSQVLGQPEGVMGIGKKTEKLIFYLADKFGLKTIDYTGINSCAKGYTEVLKYLHTQTDSKNMVVFADDYIMPKGWFDRMNNNFLANSNIDFIMPTTSFVAQNILRQDIGYHPDWDVRVAPKGDHVSYQGGYKTIYGGVTIEHINEIAQRFISNGTIPYYGDPSFETTVFTRNLVNIMGYPWHEYNQCFYDSDYFNMINNKKLGGLIAHNCWIFHYGKGGTKALYKETADEKFKESPVNHLLESDVAIWNKRWGGNIQPWWGSAND